ncbi:MAG: PEGA domain-containing protein [Myxococcales bacterium]|nr:PEGA domain-containing protein [Myxococcales bacterium]
MLSLALALSLSAAPAQLTIEVKPEGCVVKVDGKKAGTGAKPFTLKLKAGKHVIRVEFKGDATTEEMVLKAGEKKTWKWEFTGHGPETPTESPAEAPASEGG